MNRLMLEHSREARQLICCILVLSVCILVKCCCPSGVIFTALPAPPHDEDACMQYLDAMSTLSGVCGCLFLQQYETFAPFSCFSQPAFHGVGSWRPTRCNNNFLNSSVSLGVN